MEKSWNAALNLVLEIKQAWVDKYGGISEYNLEKWITDLDIEKYNEFARGVSFTHKKDKPWVLIKYSMINVSRDMWENKDSVYRECRSVVINLEKEELILVPFQKFFNLNEVEENTLETIIEDIKNAKVVEITNKLDGSMQQARFYEGEYVMSGSSALDESESFRLTEGYEFLKNNYRLMLRDYPYLTFIFEYISMKDKHVVNYDSEQQGLHLIGARSVDHDGQYVWYTNLNVIAKQYNVPIVEKLNITFEDILKMSKTYKANEKEGWVINIDGHLVKIKCDDYIQIHRLLSKISSVNLIIESIANETFDDLISRVPEAYIERVTNLSNQIYKYVHDTEFEIQKYYKEAPKEDIKQFMKYVDINTPKNIAGYVRCKYLNKKYNLLKRGNELSPGYIKASQMGISPNFKPLFDE